MKIFLAFLLFSIILISGFSYFYIKDLQYREVHFAEELVIEIPHNTSGDKIINMFNEHKLLQPGWFFKYLLRYYMNNENAKLYAGIFRFKGTMTNLEILKSLFNKTKSVGVRITIPEGMTLEEYAEIFEGQLKCDKELFLAATSDTNILNEYGIEASNAMGYLLPNTYDFNVYDSPVKIVRKLLDENKKFWTEKNLKKLEKIGYSKQEVTILASIVEAETPLKKEARIVAGLYINRLKKGMLLQADPTVQFAIGGEKQRVLFKHLKIDNPYNTYVYEGLPPGPINNPGAGALDAVLNYEKHNYLYMVSMGDGSGRHYFAKNHQEHLAFVADYKRTKDSLKVEKKMQDTLIVH